MVQLVLFLIQSGHVPESGVGETLFLEVSIWLNVHVDRHTSLTACSLLATMSLHVAAKFIYYI